jgi:photosystem II stability/assembly factor-like uncharacterized protein
VTGTLLHTTDGGIDWGVQDPETTDHLVSLHFTDQDTGWIVGGGTNYATILHTTNGGIKWYPQDAGESEFLSAIHFVDPQHGWAVGFNGTILHTVTGGE